MPRYGNYSFVVDSSFNPLSMQEMLVPLQMYKEEYNKTEAAYEVLVDKSDKFKYLSETLPEDSRAAQIYKGYANELSKQANDLAAHGLNMNNRRALTQLKRRYQGEIGRLDAADAALQEEMKLRRQMDAKDGSMLYATNNLSIDDFLDNNKPNLYNISGNELYARGAAAGKAASSRIYGAGDGGSTLGGYYKKWIERNGYSPESIQAFREGVDAIPELSKAVDDILTERGVDNLSIVDQARARQSVINGIIDGAIYNEKINVQRDLGQLTASERASEARAQQTMAMNAAANGMQWNGNSWEYNPDLDPAVQKAVAVAKAKQEGSKGGSSGSSSSSSSSKSSSNRVTQGEKPIRISWTGNDPADEKYRNKYDVADITDDKHVGGFYTFDELPDYAKELVYKRVGDGSTDLYEYYFQPYQSGLNDTEASLEIVPKKVTIYGGGLDATSLLDLLTETGVDEEEE